MKSLNIASTRTTPSVVFDASANTLTLTGDSYPEDSIPFYRNILKQIEAHFSEERPPFTVVFRLNYYNTSSSKCILDVLELLERFYVDKKQDISIQWYYQEDDRDMLESGEDFESEVTMPFELIPFAKS
jgi:hypothetical protein